MELETPLDKICQIIARARDWDAQVPSNEPDEEDEDGPMSSDDGHDEMLDEQSDSAATEIAVALDDLAEDQRAEVLALAWVGNGTFDAADWDEAMSEAADLEGDSIADQLMDMPMLAAHLEAGLEAFDHSCDGIGAIE